MWQNYRDIFQATQDTRRHTVVLLSMWGITHARLINHLVGGGPRWQSACLLSDTTFMAVICFMCMCYWVCVCVWVRERQAGDASLSGTSWGVMFQSEENRAFSLPLLPLWEESSTHKYTVPLIFVCVCEAVMFLKDGLFKMNTRNVNNYSEEKKC